MATYISAAPLWAILIFIPLFLYCIYAITYPAGRAARWGIFGFYALYLAYTSALALNGVLDKNSLPPRAMTYAGIPLMLILFGLVGNTTWFKGLLKATSLKSMIRIHIFRLLGVFFLILLAYRLLPARFALFAGLGDIITAVFAYPVAAMVSKQQRGWKVALYAWNIFGIMDIVDLLIVAGLTGANGALREMAIFPFVWFPAFAPATILFLHVMIFRKLKLTETAVQQ